MLMLIVVIKLKNLTEKSKNSISAKEGGQVPNLERVYYFIE